MRTFAISTIVTAIALAASCTPSADQDKGSKALMLENQAGLSNGNEVTASSPSNPDGSKCGCGKDGASCTCGEKCGSGKSDGACGCGKDGASCTCGEKCGCGKSDGACGCGKH